LNKNAENDELPGGSNEPPDSEPPLLVKLGPYVQVALELPGMIFGALILGYVLDNRLGTTPWLLIAVTLVALMGAIARLIHWVRFFADEKEKAEARRAARLHA
jgi:F0F1-type ATP synthase assembly protein I